MSQIKAVLWDLGNVLVRFDNRNDVCRKIARGFGCADLPVLFGGEGEAAFEALDIGDMPHEKLWQEVCDKGGIDRSMLDLAMFSALYITHLKPYEDNVRFARELQKKFRMFAVSNGDFGSTFVANMLACDYDICFERIFVSMRHGFKKPRLFQEVVTVLGDKHNLAPQECLFIDDIPSYVEAARVLGMHGIVYDARHEGVDRLQDLVEAAGLAD